MEEKKKTVPRYRQIIEEEGLMKYMSKVGVTSRQCAAFIYERHK